MSQLSTQPVFRCKRAGCNNLVKVKHLSTAGEDYEGEQLRKLLEAVGRNALCEFHSQQRLWYARRGRLDDWEAYRP